MIEFLLWFGIALFWIWVLYRGIELFFDWLIRRIYAHNHFKMTERFRDGL